MQGYSRVRVDGVVHPLSDPPKLKKQEKHDIEVVVDRLTVKAGSKQRLTDSVETALRLAEGIVVLDFVDREEDAADRERRFSEKLACPNGHALSIDDLEPRSFSFNSPYAPAPSARVSEFARRSTPTSWSRPQSCPSRTEPSRRGRWGGRVPNTSAACCPGSATFSASI